MNEDIDIPERRRQEIKRYLDLTRRLWDEAERLGMQKYRDTTPESPDWQDALKLQREWEESKAYKAWHKDIHLQPRTPIECYFAKAEDQATWRKHLETKNAELMPLEGTVKDLEKECDRLRPHAKRGMKTLEAAKKGGRDVARKHHKPKREQYRTALVKYMEKNGRPPYGPGSVSLTAGRERVAARFGVSRRTVERHTKDLFTK